MVTVPADGSFAMMQVWQRYSIPTEKLCNEGGGNTSTLRLLYFILASTPGLYIAKEIDANKFEISGGKPGMKVSWHAPCRRYNPQARR
jgi:hypothetical protein